jgi:hypothetical protein
MRNFVVTVLFCLFLASVVNAQTKRPVAKATAKPAATASKPIAAPGVQRGNVVGRTYTNQTLGLEITFPDTWLISDDDFVAYMKRKGYDISPKPPRAANAIEQKKVDAAFQRLKVLFTAYRSFPGTPDNATARIAVEDVRRLDTNRPVKDAVDYVDLMRSQLKLMQMPAGYKYSETQAEQLGTNQFAFIDTSDKQGKTRLYVTVRAGYAILFSLDYTADEDLETFRDVLARASFSHK